MTSLSGAGVAASERGNGGKQLFGIRCINDPTSSIRISVIIKSKSVGPCPIRSIA